MLRIRSGGLGRKIAVVSSLTAAVLFLAYVVLLLYIGVWDQHLAEDVVVLLAIGLGVLGLAVLAGAVQLLVRRLLARPLTELSSKMAEAAGGNFLTRADDRRRDEIGDLARSFNHMLMTITDLNASIIDSDLELDAARRELTLKATIEQKNRIIEKTNARLEERLQDISTLLDLSQLLNSTMELGETVERLVAFAGQRLHVDRFVFLLADEAGEVLSVRGVHGFANAQELCKVDFRLGQGIVGTVFESGQRIYLRDIEKEPRFTHFQGLVRMSGSFLGLPARFGEHRVGVLAFGRDEVDGFRPGFIDFLQIVSNHAAMAVRNARMYERTRELATIDELTALPNRRLLLERLADEWRRHRRFNTPLSLMMVDIDHFKVINDEHGHVYGDEVLRVVARVLGSSVRDVDLVGRYGGEEFTVVLPNTTVDQALTVAEKLRRNVMETTKDLKGGGGAAGVTISLGLSMATPETPGAAVLIDEADRALYRAKGEGRNRVVFNAL